MTESGWTALATIAIALINMVGSVLMQYLRGKYGTITGGTAGNGINGSKEPTESNTLPSNPKRP